MPIRKKARGGSSSPSRASASQRQEAEPDAASTSSSSNSSSQCCCLSCCGACWDAIITDDLKQQRLSAWQPLFSPRPVLLSFTVIGVCFIAIGIPALVCSVQVRQHALDYTRCTNAAGQSCAEVLRTPGYCECRIKFELNEDFTGDVFLYYGLDNFYQNSRRYVQSVSYKQLSSGELTKTTGCEMDYPTGTDSLTGKPVAPCGFVANSMFNDTFKLYYGEIFVSTTYDGLLWWSDKRRFNNPTDWSEWDKVAKPPSWSKGAQELDPDNPENNGFLNFDFIMWMRTAGAPNFRKIWRKLDREGDQTFGAGLPAGEYTLVVKYTYPVTAFRGSKHFIVSTHSWLGSRNDFIGSAFVVVGLVLLLSAAALAVIHANTDSFTRQLLSPSSMVPF